MLQADLDALPDNATVTAWRLGALDGGDWKTLGLAILADPVMRRMHRAVIADCYRIAMSEDEPSEVEWRKLTTLSDWIDDIGGTIV